MTLVYDNHNFMNEFSDERIFFARENSERERENSERKNSEKEKDENKCG